MAHAGDHKLLDEESGVEELRPPRQGMKFVRVCASVVGCMALAGGGYLAGRRAATSTESLDHMIGEVGTPQTVEEAKQFYTDITKDMTLAEKAAVNSGILVAAVAKAAASCADATKTNKADCEGAGKVWTPEVLASPSNANLVLLNTWYHQGAATSDQTIMNHFLYDALISAAEPTTKANPAPAQLDLSYQEFGDQYSHETVGKPWPEIVKIDESVREVSLPSSASPAVQQLNHWYQHNANAEEKLDFDNRAVEHVQMGAR